MPFYGINHHKYVSCPACGKQFQNWRRVQIHKTQSLPCKKSKIQLVKPSLGGKKFSSLNGPADLQGFHDTIHQEMDVDLGVDDNSYEEGEEADGRDGFRIHEFADAAQVVGKGDTLLDGFDRDQFAPLRTTNLYYPFASREEWDLAYFLLRSRLSMADIDAFLKLYLVQRMHLSFSTAKELRRRCEMLPDGARWKSMDIPKHPRYPTKKPLVLFYRDALEVLQDILKNPLVMDHLKFTPLQVFQSASGVLRLYDEWLSGDRAWDMQAKLKQGSTLLGAIISSDKTTISVMTGNRCAHPVLISCANIDTDFLLKAVNHLFQLLALVPIPEYIHMNRNVRGVLENRLYHWCLDVVLNPLKIAARIGHLMSDPVGQVRRCHTPCAAAIVDTPESGLIACVGGGGKTSSVSTAIYTQFGDPFPHPRRTKAITLKTIDELSRLCDPADLEAYFPLAQEARTNGVDKPFWRDWALSEPCDFLTPEPLHHWHKMFWDHDIRWCIAAVSARELDYRFSILQPRRGFRHFSGGISSLKQVTGKEHRDIQRYLVPVIAGAVTNTFLVAIRALMDFRYAGQAPRFNEVSCRRMELALKEFHDAKDEIIRLGARRSTGKSKAPLDNWHIPKLEFMQSVVRSIKANGAPRHWSADTTEHAHIEVVKDPARESNNQSYESQICRTLDRLDRCRRFQLITSMKDANVDFRLAPDEYDDDGDGMPCDEGDEGPSMLNTSAELLTCIQPNVKSGRKASNFFEKAAALVRGDFLRPERPFRTFTDSSSCSAIHFVRDPDLKTRSVDEASQLLRLDDLGPALADYLQRWEKGVRTFDVGGRRTSSIGAALPFQKLRIWSKMRIQSRKYHDIKTFNNPNTIYAMPSSSEWPEGRYDFAIVNSEPDKRWPRSSLDGHFIVRVRALFTPVSLSAAPSLNCFLAYCERYEILRRPAPPSDYQELTLFNAYPGRMPDYYTGCYMLRRCARGSGQTMGDIIPVSQFRALVDVVGKFGEKADNRLTMQTSTSYCEELYLNKYFTPELFFTLEKDTAV